MCFNEVSESFIEYRFVGFSICPFLNVSNATLKFGLVIPPIVCIEGNIQLTIVSVEHSLNLMSTNDVLNGSCIHGEDLRPKN